ncbi:MAG: hypothetical protein ACLRQF_19745 [Thomasclavelia ramosa]
MEYADCLPDEQKAMQDNHAKMPKISFNDEYREVIKVEAVIMF